jgi:hypothetical protein
MLFDLTTVTERYQVNLYLAHLLVDIVLRFLIAPNWSLSS